MGPKKQVKKQVIEEPPKPVEPQIPQHQLMGYGRFQYQGGSYYEGQWRLFRGIKLKHGHGTLIVQSNSNGKQSYEGNWQEDKMQGIGIYYYLDGSIYNGEWKQNQQSGRGTLQLPNGTVYEGEWKHQLMNGSGNFIDHTGKKWEGQFSKGVFQSKRQAQLLKQKTIQLRKLQIKKEVQTTITGFLEAVAKSDKKTLKDNISPFFAAADNIKEFVKEPYAKFDQKPQQKWTQILNIAKGGQYKVLQKPTDGIIIAGERILAKQLQGNGQLVQIFGSKQDKNVKIAFVGIEGKKWILLAALEEDKKK